MGPAVTSAATLAMTATPADQQSGAFTTTINSSSALYSGPKGQYYESDYAQGPTNASTGFGAASLNYANGQGTATGVQVNGTATVVDRTITIGSLVRTLVPDVGSIDWCTVATFGAMSGESVEQFLNPPDTITGDQNFDVSVSFTGTALEFTITRALQSGSAITSYGTINSKAGVQYQYGPSLMYDQSEGLYKVWLTADYTNATGDRHGPWRQHRRLSCILELPLEI